MMSKRKLNSMVRTVMTAAPFIPYIMKRRRHHTPIGSLVLGGLGLAMVGGMALVMLLSPRTRHRAIGAAKETYGKVNDKVSHLRAGRGAGAHTEEEIPASNGLAPDYGTTTTNL